MFLCALLMFYGFNIKRFERCDVVVQNVCAFATINERLSDARYLIPFSCITFPFSIIYLQRSLNHIHNPPFVTMIENRDKHFALESLLTSYDRKTKLLDIILSPIYLFRFTKTLTHTRMDTHT